MITAVAVFVPGIEIVSGSLLAFGWLVPLSASAIISLLILFIAAIIPNLDSGNDLDCGCFGSFVQGKMDGNLLIRDIILLAATSIILRLSTKDRRLNTFNIKEGRTHGTTAEKEQLDSVLGRHSDRVLDGGVRAADQAE